MNGFYVPVQLIYGYVETDYDNDDDDMIETGPPSQGRTRVLLHPTPHRNGMRYIRLVVRHAGGYSGSILPRRRRAFSDQ